MEILLAVWGIAKVVLIVLGCISLLVLAAFLADSRSATTTSCSIAVLPNGVSHVRVSQVYTPSIPSRIFFARKKRAEWEYYRDKFGSDWMTLDGYYAPSEHCRMVQEEERRLQLVDRVQRMLGDELNPRSPSFNPRGKEVVHGNKALY